MTSSKARRYTSTTSLAPSGDSQAFPLRPLATSTSDSALDAGIPPSPATTTPASPGQLHDRRTYSSPLPLERDEPVHIPDTHGRRLESQSDEETVDESIINEPGETASDDFMTKERPFPRSAAAHSGPSYGAISPPPRADNRAAQEHGDPLSESEHAVRRASTTSRRSDGRSSVRLSTRKSGELGGSTTVGGLEGRFGTTETPLLNDLIEDPKLSDEEGTEDGLLDAGSDIDDDQDDDENDPPDNSPYPQVRASVAPTDNTTLSINTPRMWALSILFSILGSSTNLFFSLRYPSVAITPVIALLLVHPLGLMWDYFLKRADDPPEEYVDGCRSENASVASPRFDRPHIIPWERRSKLGRLRLWLAQGRWNEKEHSCVYVSSNVSFGFAFATDVIVEQTQFYKQDAGIIYQLLLTLSTQILGYTFAGLTRRFLVRPSGMIWPGTLMSAAMFTTLHKEENKEANGWRISRWTFFYAVWLSAFLFYFLPGLLMPALSYFNVITWFAPNNVVVANLFGVVSGLGLFPVTFDWAQIAYIGSPLLTPFWAAMNVVGGLVVVMWIIAPIAYYSNWLYSSYMPILSAAVFDNTGNVYDVSKVLTKDFVFDREAYSNYSRVFLPITYVLSYGVQFAGLASLLTHTVCWHGSDIWTQWKKSLEETKSEPKATYAPLSASSTANGEPGRRPRRRGPRVSLTRSASSTENLMNREDVHNRLMKRYKDAPMLWYLATFVSMTAIGIFVVEYYPIHLPWYGLLLALAICSVLFIPIGIIMAVTNQHSSIYLICQLVAGVVFPGRPVANMVFVTYGYISSAQGIKFAADLKLGHYMKIPPRILFSVQMVATVVSSVTQIAVLNWMFAHVPGICTPQAINGFTCPIARVHFNGSILWGVVGPREFFGPGATYRALVWAFAVGAVLPVPLWLYARNRRHSIVRKISLPVLFGSLGWIPPATGLNFSVWALVCYVFNYLVKNRAQAWWAKYTMTLSAALDSGLAFGIVVVFFGFIYPGWMKGFSWWGTEVYKQGCDWQACSYLTVPEGGRFGPDVW
ncbi:OPT oligopeptide transporter protein-domain-containing protein [Podospora appendiculata]|uniref:OPT oligopeptide transporter protein-domain-containing protein n=1 Tax=Podospora appendiculata TaxID=314037 RepID=A0AAE0X7C6_9PEZI|nr:OPT oligopeptide transporter protein-domain-containing protein [Podospora appendiculata]